MSATLIERVDAPEIGGAQRRRRRGPITPAGWIGAVLVLLAIVAAVFAPALAPHDYAHQSLDLTLLPPFWMHGANASFPLGTDQLGRDLLSRIIWGARTSLLVGAGAVLIAGFIGVAIGLVSGYAGGLLDEVLMRLVDIQLAFPPIFLAIAIMAVIGQSLLNVVLVLGIVSWVQYARVARSSTLSVKEREYVTAARVLGASTPRLMLQHVLPNVLVPIIAISTVNVSVMILAEAGLSFLGLGVQPPTPAWGGMLAESRDILTLAWWNAVFPGIAILVTVLGINLLGDSLSRE